MVVMPFHQLSVKKIFGNFDLEIVAREKHPLSLRCSSGRTLPFRGCVDEMPLAEQAGMKGQVEGSEVVWY